MLFQPFAKRSGGIVHSAHERHTTRRTGISLLHTVKHHTETRTAMRAGNAIRHAMMNLFVRKLEIEYDIHLNSQPREQCIKSLRLRERAGESIQDKLPRPMSIEPPFDHLQGDLIRKIHSSTGPGVGLTTDFRPASALLTKKRTRRGRRVPILGGEHFRLGALAGGRRPQQNDPALQIYLFPVTSRIVIPAIARAPRPTHSQTSEDSAMRLPAPTRSRVSRAPRMRPFRRKPS